MDVSSTADTAETTDDSTNGEYHSQSEQAQSSAQEQQRYPLGVLLVHGVGEQHRGETITYAGEPLYQWVRSWVEGANKRHYNAKEIDRDDPPKWADVSMENTRLTERIPSEGDAPPFGILRLQRSKDMHSADDELWMLAESFWADELTPPTFDELLKWGLGMGPWMLNRSGPPLLKRMSDAIDHRWQVAREVLNSDRGENPLLRFISLLATWILTIVEVPTIFLIKFLSTSLFYVAGFLAQVLMLAVQLLSVIPALSNMVLSIQKGLAAGLAGDAYLMAISPMRMNSVISQVQRDLAWMLDRCDKVAIIAHSGGGKVTFEALSIPGAHNDKIALFVSYGSGLNKQTALENILPQDSDWAGMFFAISPFLLVASIVFAFLSITPLGATQVSWIPFIATAPLWVLFAPAAAIFFAIFVVIGNIVKDKNRMVGVPMPPYKVPHDVLWKDYFALADVISDGKTYMTVEPGNPRAAGSISLGVNNLHSIIKDHSSYWKNNEEFVAPISSELFKATNNDSLMTSHDRHIVNKAQVLRRNRVYTYLAAGILSAFSIPLLSLGLGAGFIAIGTTVGNLVIGLLSILRIGIDALSVASPTFWGYFWGFASIIIIVVLWHRVVLFPTWRLWSRKETDEMFARRYDDSGHVNAMIYLLLICVVPLVTLVALLWRSFAPTNTLYADVNVVVAWVLTTLHLVSSGLDSLVSTVTIAADVLILVVASIVMLTALVIGFAGRRFLSIRYTTVEKMENKVADRWKRKEEKRTAKHNRDPHAA